jgi:carbon-monoxide dehydrogenase small subunit
MERLRVNIQVNGEQKSRVIPAQMSLLEFLREELLLTGTKEGCSNGECGACTVLVDGVPMRSCIMLAAEASGSAVTTIEGLEQSGELETIRDAFVRHDAVQCGFCTPGFIMAQKALFDREERPSRRQMEEALGGHLCRCTGYESIFAAVSSLAESRH